MPSLPLRIPQSPSTLPSRFCSSSDLRPQSPATVRPHLRCSLDGMRHGESRQAAFRSINRSRSMISQRFRQGFEETAQSGIRPTGRKRYTPGSTYHPIGQRIQAACTEKFARAQVAHVGDSESPLVLQPLLDLLSRCSAVVSAAALVCTEYCPSTRSCACGAADPRTNSESPSAWKSMASVDGSKIASSPASTLSGTRRRPPGTRREGQARFLSRLRLVREASRWSKLVNDISRVMKPAVARTSQE